MGRLAEVIAMTIMQASRIARAALAFAATSFATAPVLLAQEPAPTAPTITVDAHWLPFLGCWNTVTGGRLGPVTCLLTTADPARIELATVSADSATVQETFELTGTPVRFTRDGCTGTNTTSWSTDERSFFVRTEVACDGTEAQKLTSVFTMRTTESFVRAQSMAVRSRSAVRVVEFRALDDNGRVPQAVLQRLPAQRSTLMQQARSAALAKLSAADVRDALLLLDAPLAEAWIAGHGQPVLFSGTDLKQMSGANVPERVLDMMIAVSNPETFTLTAAGEPVRRERMSQQGAQRRMASDVGTPLASLGSFGCGFTMGMYVPLSCLPMSTGLYDCYNGYGTGYGMYSAMAYGRGGWNSAYCNDLFNRYRQNVVVVYPGDWVNGGTPSSQPAPVQRGQMIRGRGYSQGTGGESRGPAQPVDRPVTQTAGASTRTATAGGGGYSSGSSSTGSSSSGSSSASGGGEQRTAKPRP